jgi:uncharacterized RDD family membrane protein YckC
MGTPGTTVVFCTACGAHNAPDARFCQTCGQPMVPVNPVPVTTSIAAYAANPYGGFWIRLLAWLIDTAIIYGVLVPASIFSGIVLHGLAGLAGLCGGWLYFALMESSSMQATLGKMICNLRVTDLHARRISFGRATGRYFAKWLSAAILCIGFLMIGFTDRKQGLHDMIAGTLVMRGRAS